MKNRIVHIVLLFFLAFMACKEKPDKPAECSVSDCFMLSELENKSDYYLPFTLYNDLMTSVQKVVLNGEQVALENGKQLKFEQAGFYNLEIFYNDGELPASKYLFTLITEEREAAEWGIETWVPKAFEVTEEAPTSVEHIYNNRYLDGMALPVIVYAREGNALDPRYYKARESNSGTDFFIKHGVGSVSVSATAITENIEISITGNEVSLPVSKVQDEPIILEGELTENLVLQNNAVAHITGNLTIPAGLSFTINEGCIIVVDEGVNIYNTGPIQFLGTADNPVLVTCSSGDKYWGGFISNGSSGTIEAMHTIFCRSGYHDSEAYKWGHAQRQALFYTANSELTLNSCYITDHIGQIFYPLYSTLTLNSILVQRVKTSGQLNYSQAEITNSIFTDFPDDSQVYRDSDNDALYLAASDVTIDNCKFMFAKDDGLDSGGDLGGTVVVTNSLFEACFHEGAALSSADEVLKTHTFLNCTFTNCGQGLELGFSSPNHEVYADNCQFVSNGVGIRYGDNYTWSAVNGNMYIRNSVAINNTRDVWNMIRSTWMPKLDHMHFENVQVSVLVPQYPELEIY